MIKFEQSRHSFIVQPLTLHDSILALLDLTEGLRNTVRYFRVGVVLSPEALELLFTGLKEFFPGFNALQKLFLNVFLLVGDPSYVFGDPVVICLQTVLLMVHHSSPQHGHLLAQRAYKLHQLARARLKRLVHLHLFGELFADSVCFLCDLFDPLSHESVLQLLFLDVHLVLKHYHQVFVVPHCLGQVLNLLEFTFLH